MYLSAYVVYRSFFSLIKRNLLPNICKWCGLISCSICHHQSVLKSILNVNCPLLISIYASQTWQHCIRHRWRLELDLGDLDSTYPMLLNWPNAGIMSKWLYLYICFNKETRVSIITFINFILYIFSKFYSRC